MWSKELENIIQKLGDDAIIFEKLHKDRAIVLTRWKTCLLHLNLLCGGASTFLTSYSIYTNNYMTGLLSCFTTSLSFIIGGIFEKSDLENRINQHENASIEYNKISSLIIREFGKEEKSNGDEFLKNVIDRMSELYKSSPNVDKKVYFVFKNVVIENQTK